MVTLETINRDLYKHRINEDNHGRYFTVYLGHNQYYELKNNPNYYHYIYQLDKQPELLFGKVFICLVEEENYYHFTIGQNNI